MLCPWHYLRKKKHFNNTVDILDLNNNESNGKFRFTSKGDDPQLIQKDEALKENLKVKDVSENLEKHTGTKPHSRCPFIRLKNIENGNVIQDTLHQNAIQNLPCKSKTCHGSIMTPKVLTRGPRSKPVPPEELLVQAIEFINQYYHSFKKPKTEEHLARVEAVTKEIETTGTYQLEVAELVYASKQAWRNAPRCIGRIQWSNLQVFDARSCTTAQEMFQFICNHIKFASNNGNLRSVITIFPQRTDGKHDFRVWNSQLIRYAGYLMPDGSILGDPANIEFTEMCIHLGWKPKNGRFDVLPLILQANGEDPELFEIPPDIILEVPMEHPRFDWFQELNLKWYALPAVANMLLEVGGLEFTACPFNGWYMGTEIGVRDFCDTQRYNILEEVGKKMGLETNKLASLWKDQALVEINIAVLHSFQKNNVTIMDHHSASESFMKHMQNEVRLRGGCPADWVWLVPPMSGSITPIFHQEMLNYVLSPYYYYQVDPWITHEWKDENKKPIKRQIKFKDLARAVFFASYLMHKVMAARVKATILYATETGKSETFARKLNTVLNSALNSRVVCMDDYDFSELETETLVVVITSTFGNGDSPGNGESFKKSIFAKKQLNNKFRYCVFGLGSRTYPQFCAFAHTIDERLRELGAFQIAPTGEGDELCGQEESFATWATTVFKNICKEFEIQGQPNSHLEGLGGTNPIWEPEKHRVSQEIQTVGRVKALSMLHSKDVFGMKLKSRRNLQSPDSSRSTILLQLISTESQDLVYLPGEHLGVFPGNQIELVSGVIKRLKDAPPSHQNLRLEVLTQSDQGSTKSWITNSRLPPCSIQQALTYFLDITTPPSQLLLKKMCQLTCEEEERRQLEKLAKDTETYKHWKDFRSPTLLEVLDEFPSLEITTSFILSQLPPLKPRFYSISSSQDLNPQEIHLTVAVVCYNTQDGQGPVHYGVCSNWLNTIKEGDLVPCFIRSTSNFLLHKEPNAPTILVGPGTGIAPFRSFWQQRLHDMEKEELKTCPMTLVFGCRQSAMDHIYKDEMLEMKRKGVLDEVYTAYSREPDQKKVYVQDILREQLSEKVFMLLYEKKGHIYICGDIRMAQDVAHTLKEILAAKLGKNMEKAEKYLTQLKLDKRYHEDIFGVVFQK
ncbi:nitric oxide synthase 2b, inducible [Polypterus senegalus]|uniref:nitric oxide synthase 2b, inducible n=1 Tax=Polypterus senegalus TaxID=55291 RepID=UPI0019658C8B|nr:nitric oxide synthase 2b, inducible [Polypterus senegalus]